MSRMHSGGKGRSGSNKPSVSDAPAWSDTDKKDVEEYQLPSLVSEKKYQTYCGT